MRDFGPASPPVRILFIAWAVGIGLVATWAFAPEAAPPQILEVNRGEAFDSNEELFVRARNSQRQDALKTLGRPWGSRCAGEERKRFISGLNEYYYHRQNQTERYPEIYGKLGADYLAKQW